MTNTIEPFFWSEAGELDPSTDLNELRSVGMWDGKLIETTTAEEPCS